MTTFLYLSDTHLGANPMGFQQQRGYPEALPQLLDVLSQFVADAGDIDFVLHGGDMIDVTNDDTLQAASKAFSLSIPLYLCLGNHDLTTPDAATRWLAAAPQFFPGSALNYTIETDDCLIHVMPNHWQDEPFYWATEQRPHFKDDQVDWLNGELAKRPDLPHILSTHSPTFGVPAEQTGMAQPFHYPGDAFASEVTAFTDTHPQLKCVLGAHSHVNMCLPQNDVPFITSSALVETPFEFKRFEVTSDHLTMTTHALSLNCETEYNEARAYAQGRPADRSFSLRF